MSSRSAQRAPFNQTERRTHDDIRHGTTTLFAALNAKSGKVISECHHRQPALEFRKFLDPLEVNRGRGRDVRGFEEALGETERTLCSSSSGRAARHTW